MSEHAIRLIVAAPPPARGSALKKHVPLGALSIATALESQKIESEIFDLQLVGDELGQYDVHALATAILDGPRVVGISVLCDGLPLVALACEEAKRIDPDKIIVLGGAGPSAVATQLMEAFPSIDVIVIGEGEITAQQLFPLLLGDHPFDQLNAVSGIAYRSGDRVITTPARPLLFDLDSLPIPDYRLLRLHEYETAGVVTSRGCPYHCAFCSTAPLWGRRVRYKSADRVACEMKALTSFGFGSGRRNIGISDDLFTSSIRHVRDVCEALRRRGLHSSWSCCARADTLTPQVLQAVDKAGCRGVAIGLESGSDRVLKAIRKGITSGDSLRALERAYECLSDVKLFLMWGFPSETLSDLMLTMVFVCRAAELLPLPSQVLHLTVTLAAPLPGSALYDHHLGDAYLDFDVYFRYGGAASGSFLRERAIREAVGDTIAAHRELFSAYWMFRQEDSEAKLKLLRQARVWGR